MGPRLAAYSRAEDHRRVRHERTSKSISSETTFGHDLGALHDLQPILARLAGRVAARVQRGGVLGWTLTLKLKTEHFQTFTRRQKLPQPIQDEATLIKQGEVLLRRELARGPFRLMGLGLSDFTPQRALKPAPQQTFLNESRNPRAET